MLEECGTSEMASGMQMGAYNSTNMHPHPRGEGGAEERELGTRYRNWSRRLAFEYPFVARMLEDIAADYDCHAEWQDSRAAVRRRLWYQ